MSNSNRKATKVHPFLHAVSDGDIAKVKAFILAGVDIHMKAPDGGKRPLHIATHRGNKEMVSALLELKADPRLVTDGQFSALHVAAQIGRPDLIFTLVKAVGDDHAVAYVNAPTKVGCTPLHEAAAKGHREATLALLSLKADPTARDYRYMLTPADLAGINGHTALQATLVKSASSTSTSTGKTTISLLKQHENKLEINRSIPSSSGTAGSTMPTNLRNWHEFKAILDKKKKAKNVSDKLKINTRFNTIIPQLHFDQDAILIAGLSLQQILDVLKNRQPDCANIDSLPALINSITKAIADERAKDIAALSTRALHPALLFYMPPRTTLKQMKITELQTGLLESHPAILPKKL